MVIVKEMYSVKEYWGFSWCGFNAEHSCIDYEFMQHTHDFSEAFIILSGSATHNVGTRSYPLKRGDVFVIKGNVAHGFSDVQSLEIINLMYNPSLFLAAEAQLSHIPGFRPLFIVEPEIRVHSDYPYVLSLDDKALSYVESTADLIVDELEKKIPDHDTVVTMTFWALIAFLSIKYEVINASSQKIQLLSDTIRYMQANLSLPMKISEVAAQVFISPRHLDRLFREYYNSTPIEYLTNLRLQHAVNLLSKSGMRVAHVAEQCGFSDPSYFSRVFKQVYGITPHLAAKLIE